MAAKDEGGNDGFLGELRDLAQLMEEIISQDPVHEVESNQGEKKEVLETESTETSNQLAGLSTTYNVLRLAYKKSDLANLETRNVPVTSGEAVPLVSEPSSRYQSAWRFGTINGCDIANDETKSVPSSDLASKYNLPDDEEVTNPIDYSSSDYDVVRYQLSLLSVENDDSKEFADDASLKHYMSKIYSYSSDHLEAEQPVNPAQPSLQRQNAMHRQRYTSKLDPRYSASSVHQPMPTRQRIPTTTASSHGRRPSISMTEAFITSTEFVPQTQRNQQAMNPHYSQRQYGNMTNSLYTPPDQNEGYNMPQSAAAFQQLGGGNTAHNGNMITSPYWRPEQNDSYNMPPQLDASVAPYAYGSVNLFGTSSDNVAADSRFGYEGRVSRNHLPSIQQHQSGDSYVWPPSSRHGRQRREEDPWPEIFATMNQQNDRSHDLSDQTQQWLRPRDN